MCIFFRVPSPLCHCFLLFRIKKHWESLPSKYRSCFFPDPNIDPEFLANFPPKTSATPKTTMSNPHPPSKPRRFWAPVPRRPTRVPPRRPRALLPRARTPKGIDTFSRLRICGVVASSSTHLGRVVVGPVGVVVSFWFGVVVRLCGCGGRMGVWAEPEEWCFAAT